MSKTRVVNDLRAVGDRRRWEYAWRVEIGGRVPAMTVGVVWCLPGVVSTRGIVSFVIRVYLVGEGEDRESRRLSVIALRWLIALEVSGGHRSMPPGTGPGGARRAPLLAGGG